jgi:excisionase family DNA binding protein
MQDELQLIHEKLDLITKELTAIRASMQIVSNGSPPLTIEQAAAYLHLSVSRVYDLVYAGKLQPLQHRKHGRLLFSNQHLNQYLYEKK